MLAHSKGLQTFKLFLTSNMSHKTNICLVFKKNEKAQQKSAEISEYPWVTLEKKVNLNYFDVGGFINVLLS